MDPSAQCDLQAFSLPLEQYVHIRIQRLLPAAAPELWRPKSLVKCRLLLATSQDVKAWKWIEIFKDPTWSKSDWNQSDLEEFCKSQFSCNTRASRLDSIALVPWLLWLVEVLHKGPPADRECRKGVVPVKETHGSHGNLGRINERTEAAGRSTVVLVSRTYSKEQVLTLQRKYSKFNDRWPLGWD